MRKIVFPKRHPRIVIGGPITSKILLAGVQKLVDKNPDEPHWILAFGKVFIVVSPTLKPEPHE